MGKECGFFPFFFLEVYELFQVKCCEGTVVLQLKASDILPKGLPDLEVNLRGLDSDLMILLLHQFLWEAPALTLTATDHHELNLKQNLPLEILLDIHGVGVWSGPLYSYRLDVSGAIAW